MEAANHCAPPFPGLRPNKQPFEMELNVVFKVMREALRLNKNPEKTDGNESRRAKYQRGTALRLSWQACQFQMFVCSWLFSSGLLLS